MSRNDPGLPRLAMSISLTPKLDQLITQQAERSGVSRAAVVRGVLERYFAGETTTGSDRGRAVDVLPIRHGAGVIAERTESPDDA